MDVGHDIITVITAILTNFMSSVCLCDVKQYFFTILLLLVACTVATSTYPMQKESIERRIRAYKACKESVSLPSLHTTWINASYISFFLGKNTLCSIVAVKQLNVFFPFLLHNVTSGIQ